MINDQCNPRIMQLLTEKSSVKQEVYRKSQDYFQLIKQTVNQVALNLNSDICKVDESVKVEYKDKNNFECEIHFGGDILLFNMHTNVFTFKKSHAIWRNGYVKEDVSRAYFTMINIYNFLADSIKYHRTEDMGVLLGRLFINREGHFFVEGKRQLGFLFSDLAHQEVGEQSLKEVVDTAIIQGLEFDLTVPDYRDVMLVSVREIMETSNELHLKTSKNVEIGYYSRMESDQKKIK
jgi:hypothetical protein